MIKITHEKDHWRNLLESLVELHTYFFYEGRLKEAENVLKQSEQLLLISLNNKFIGLFYYYYSSFLVNMIFYKGYSPENVIQIIDKGLSYIDEFQDEEIYSMLLDQKGSGLYYSELVKEEPDYSNAKKFLNLALEIRQKKNNLKNISETLFNLALIDEKTGNTEEALKKYKESYKIAKENNFELELSEAARHIGFSHYLKGEYLEALDYFIESNNIRVNLKFKSGAIFTKITMGDVYIALKKFSEAEKELMNAYSDSIAFGIDRGVMISALSLGELFIEMKNKIEAKKYLEIANTLAKQLDHVTILKMIESFLLKLE
jgi:tetratricopeptide (TPR) repeat protein